MNDARFSMRLPHDTLVFAQNYAAQNHMSLTDLVLGYFERLKQARTQPAEGTVRDLSAYVGIAQTELTDKEIDDARFKHLMEKYA